MRFLIGTAGAVAAFVAYTHYRSTRKRRVVITGGCGNLGTKLATRLLATGQWEVVRLATAHVTSCVGPQPAPASVRRTQGHCLGSVRGTVCANPFLVSAGEGCR